MSLPLQGSAADDTPHPQASLHRVRDALAQRGDPMKGTTSDFKARCPIHDDNEASLHVSYVPGDDGRVLLRCFGCQGEVRDIAAALGLEVTDLFDRPLPPREERVGRSTTRRRTGKRWGKIGPLPAPIVAPEREPEEQLDWQVAATYDYARPDGEVIQQVIRKEATNAAGERRKTFTQTYFTAKGQVSKKPQGFEPTWYRCPELVDALADDETVWILEGEKDVHTAEERLDVVAATNAGGAGSLSDAMLDMLEGGTVRVVVDRDGAGYKRGAQLLEALEGRADVRVFLPRTLEAKTDLTDHVDDGGTLEDLIETSLAELHTWAAASQLEGALSRIEEADREARAHIDAAEERAESAPKAAETHRKRATRWTIESEVRLEKLTETTTTVERYATVAKTDWAEEAVRLAHSTRERGIRLARTLHEHIGRDIPPALQLPAETPKPVAEVPAPAPVPEVGPAPELAQDGGADRAPRQFDVEISAPKYVLINGQICKEEWKPARGGEGEYVRNLKRILDLDARIIARDANEVLDDADFVDQIRVNDVTAAAADGIQETRTGTGDLKQYLLAYTHPLSGEQIITKVDADDFTSSKWLERLDFAVDYAATTNGRAEVARAITQVSVGYKARTMYRGVGWRRRKAADGSADWGYVHAGGIITREGNEHAPVALDAPLNRIQLPPPSTNTEELRTAFSTVIEPMLETCPRRVILPLLGFMMRSAIGHNPMITVLVGVPGTLKSSLASWAMSFFGETWERNKPCMSLAGTGDTSNAARIGMSRAKDCVWWADDAAPDRGIAYAQRALKENARMIAERIGRSRATRDGNDVNPGARPNASGLFTSEFAPEAGSGQQRTFPLPLRAGDISVDLMKQQSKADPRFQRTLLMSSFIHWLAKNDPQLVREQANLDADEELHRLRQHYLTRGVADERPGAAITQMWVGFKIFLEFLRDVGVLDDDSAQDWMTSLNESLFEAWQATVDPDIPTSTGGRVREMLQYALHSGIAYLSHVQDGAAPSFPLAARLGWKRQGGAASERVEARGIPLGWINPDSENGPEIYLEPRALPHVLAQARTAMDVQIELDEATAKRALYDEGILVTDAAQPGKAPKMTKTRNLPCIGARTRVLVIPFGQLFPDDDEGGDPRLFGKRAPTGPTPLTRRSTTPASPSSAPAQQQPAATAPAATAQAQGAVALAPQRDAQPATQPPAPTPAQVPAEQPQTQERPFHVVRTQEAPSTLIGPAAVLDVDTIYTPDGKRHAWPELTHVGQLAELLPALGIGHSKGDLREVGQLWITHAAALKLGLPVDQLGDDPSEVRSKLSQLTTGHELITRAERHGYRVGGKGTALSNWTRIFRSDQDAPIAMLVIISALPEDYPMIGGNPTPQELVERIRDAATAVGIPLYMHPGQTGIDLAIKLRRKGMDVTTSTGQREHRRVKELFAPYAPVPPAEASNTERDLDWSRIPDEQERQLPYLHAYDRGGSYMAGAASLELSIGEPVHHPDGRPFDKRLPGYWLIDVPENGDWRLPNPLAPGGTKAPDHPIWVTTPTLELAQAQGYGPEIHEAYTWPEHGRVLQPFYEQIKNGRTALLQRLDRLAHPTDEAGIIDLTTTEHALDALKAVYTRMIGMMGSASWMQGKQGFAPERRHHIIAKSRANILRTVEKNGLDSGIWPIAIGTDTICYLSANPDPIASWPGDPSKLGRGFGQYKHEGSAQLADHLEFLTGRDWRGKASLIDPADWDPTKE